MSTERPKPGKRGRGPRGGPDASRSAGIPHGGQRGRSRAGVVVGRRAVLEAIAAGNVTEVRVASSAHSTPAMRDLLEAARAGGVPVRTVERAELDGLDSDHQGVAATTRSPVGRGLGERDLSEHEFGDEAVVVVLDGVTDPQNLGAAARSAEAAGAEMLVTRVRRAAGVTPAAIGASAGALMHLPHARVANIPRALKRLQTSGFQVVGLDDAAERSIYDEVCPSGPVALVVGSEGAGLSRLVRESCDHLVALPMRGRVGSLNVSASLAAALYAYVLPSRAD